MNDPIVVVGIIGIVGVFVWVVLAYICGFLMDVLLIYAKMCEDRNQYEDKWAYWRYVINFDDDDDDDDDEQDEPVQPPISFGRN